MYYPSTTPHFLQTLFPQIVFSYPSSNLEKTLYLTFDDGPTPEITEWVLSLLAAYEAQATFFCIGKNVQQHPLLFEKIKTHRHAIGNHTHHHLNGWLTSNAVYLADIQLASKYIPSYLFRPPYGRLGIQQVHQIRKQLVSPTIYKASSSNVVLQGYKIIMWSILSGDFDKNLDAARCFRTIVKEAKSGSIIVFHDSIKAAPLLRVILPKVLQYYSNLGYRFKACY